ncbi:hypothetical protein [Novosphingobium sp. NBM11]|uniref:hypothetical protein n=1 Tax=Novosphingobium sp. NBM11 TaxID=2596914 RepID=UPI001892270C|nr:hypothetical protein [Novosphingobium sp. NBM11]
MIPALCCAVSFLLLCEADREPSRAFAAFLRVNAVLIGVAALLMAAKEVAEALS